MRDDVAAFADALLLNRFTLIGHSMGGTVAFLFTERRPHWIEQLVSIDTAPPFVGDASLDAFDDDDADEEEESDDSPTFDPQVWKAIFRQLRQPDPLWWSELPRISAPTLIIGGGSTSHVPQEKLAEAAELIPDCQLETIEGAGHMVYATRPEECEALLRRFLVR
jgi:esterase